MVGCAGAEGSLHRGCRPDVTRAVAAQRIVVMRAEIEKLVEEIKQSVGLLRRHL
jgi:hypothetical protein